MYSICVYLFWFTRLSSTRLFKSVHKSPHVLQLPNKRCTACFWYTELICIPWSIIFPSRGESPLVIIPRTSALDKASIKGGAWIFPLSRIFQTQTLFEYNHINIIVHYPNSINNYYALRKRLHWSNIKQGSNIPFLSKSLTIHIDRHNVSNT